MHPLDFLCSQLDISIIISVLAVCATVSITFITLLFAIAAINYSFQGKKSQGAYHLKLLIKSDLIKISIRTIILPIIGMFFALLLSPIVPRIIWALVLLGIMILMICSLWNATNSVYYSIVQQNRDDELSCQINNVRIIDTDSIVDIPLQKYDVYTHKKTLYPKLRKKIPWKFSRKERRYSKIDLVNMWEEIFVSEVYKIMAKVKKKCGSDRLVDVLKIKCAKSELKPLKPKIQAPNVVTKICLDRMLRILEEKGKTADAASYQYLEIEELEWCLVLLYSSKIYAESRQEERSRHNVMINRAFYTNPDDSYLYTLYGNILYYLGEKEMDKDGKMAHYNEAIEAYICANIADASNSLAKHNRKIVERKIIP